MYVIIGLTGLITAGIGCYMLHPGLLVVFVGFSIMKIAKE